MQIPFLGGTLGQEWFVFICASSLPSTLGSGIKGGPNVDNKPGHLTSGLKYLACHKIVFLES